MAIIAHGAEPIYRELIGSECFYCYRPVYPPGVMWSGAAGELVLHPACVLDLFLRLGRDVWDVERRIGAYLALPGADPRFLEPGTRLNRPERGWGQP
jgi:hypothetical protein